MIFRLNDFAVGSIADRLHSEGSKTMNRLRCFFLAAMIVISSSAFTLGGEMQVPGKSNPTPTPAPAALTTASTNDAVTQSTSAEEIQIVWQDTTTMLMEILLTIF